MTERKPPGMKIEDWIESQIRDAQRKGEFDNLPGTGKPIPRLAEPHDDNWWVKDYIRREKIDADALLPPALLLRKEKERLPETVRKLRSEQAVRDLVANLNQRILACLRDATGPVIPVGRVEADEVVALWQSQRETEHVVEPQPEAAAEPVSQRWWRRWRRPFRA